MSTEPSLGILSSLLLIGLLYGLISLLPALREQRAQRSLIHYPDADWLGEDSAYWGVDTALKSQYYWSEDNVDEVEAYFEGEMQEVDFFVATDSYGQWLIIPLGNSVTIESDNVTQALGHGSFCDYKSRRLCVTVVLVDASQEDLLLLSIISPLTFREPEHSEYLQSLSSNGTLIIYNYWVDDF